MAGIERGVVEAVLDDHRSAPIAEPFRRVLDLLHALTVEPRPLEVEDIEPLLAAGLSKSAIYEAMYVAFAFNVLDRVADSFDFAIHDARHQNRVALMLRAIGYRRGILP